MTMDWFNYENKQASKAVERIPRIVVQEENASRTNDQLSSDRWEQISRPEIDSIYYLSTQAIRHSSITGVVTARSGLE